MEFEINIWDLYDLELLLGDEDKLIVDWEHDPDYSPKEGLYNKFSWSLILLKPDGKRVDITDELSSKDSEYIEEQIEEACDDGI